MNFLSPEAKLVHGHGQVSGLAEALVGVAVVHGDQVDVAEDEAVVVVLLQSLSEADVQQLGSVEDLVSVLRQKHQGNVMIIIPTGGSVKCDLSVGREGRHGQSMGPGL